MHIKQWIWMFYTNIRGCRRVCQWQWCSNTYRHRLSIIVCLGLSAKITLLQWTKPHNKMYCGSINVLLIKERTLNKSNVTCQQVTLFLRGMILIPTLNETMCIAVGLEYLACLWILKWQSFITKRTLIPSNHSWIGPRHVVLIVNDHHYWLEGCNEIGFQLSNTIKHELSP